MSAEHFEELVRTGRLPATGETFISPTRAFSEAYRGALVEFKMQPGVLRELESVGVRDASRLARGAYPDMPLAESGWGETNAFFKGERTQINIGLGRGAALDIFNSYIESFLRLR